VLFFALCLADCGSHRCTPTTNSTYRRTASHFFKDSPSRDEKTAIAHSSDIDFDAGIQDSSMKKKGKLPLET
jgi:hypothetical protein